MRKTFLFQMFSAFTLVIVLSTGILTQASLAQVEQQAPVKIDVLSELQWLPIQYIGAIIDHFETKGEKYALEISIKDSMDNPGAYITLNFTWKDGLCQITTDEKGEAEFELTKERTLDLLMEIPDGFTPQIGHSVGGMAVSGGYSGEGVGILDLATLERISNRGIEVFYQEGNESIAWRALSDMERTRGFIRGFVDLPLKVPFGIALHDLSEEYEYLIILMNAGIVVFPMSVSAFDPDFEQGDDEQFIPWAISHEWFEFSLISLGLFKDSRLRFLHDGLAELLSYEYSRRFYPDAVKPRLEVYINRLQPLLDQGITEYDMPGVFHSRAGTGDNMVNAGYAVSFWAMQRVLEKGGLDSLRELITWIRKGENLDLDHVLEAIFDISGYEVKPVVPVKQVLDDIQSLLERN